ncbi:MAG: anti-sigma factor [Bacteroidota bacterium]|nr:anti-sigma factor [Bacteroidota bacterium]
MNIKEYLESGIIENYVLGVASQAEQKEFESLCGQYPELLQAKRLFELALETEMLKKGVPPPPELIEKILLSINTPGGPGFQKFQKGYDTLERKMKVWKLVVVVCLLLLGVNIYIAYSINNKYKILQIENIELKNRLDHARYVDAIQALNPILQKSSIKWSTMVEPANSSHCMAHIYWDSVSTNTYLLVGNIPKPVSDKQFQLWAITDNQPINLGVFDIRKEGQLIQMKNVQKAKIFVITIEPRGGSATPSMEVMYAKGKI